MLVAEDTEILEFKENLVKNIRNYYKYNNGRLSYYWV